MEANSLITSEPKRYFVIPSWLGAGVGVWRCYVVSFVVAISLGFPLVQKAVRGLAFFSVRIWVGGCFVCLSAHELPSKDIECFEASGEIRCLTDPFNADFLYVYMSEGGLVKSCGCEPYLAISQFRQRHRICVTYVVFCIGLLIVHSFNVESFLALSIKI